MTFARSSKTVAWRPENGTLLDHAEKAGQQLAFGCRSGSCGQCAVKTAGPVKYLAIPDATPGNDETLICHALPDATEGGEPVAITLDV